jgi:type IV secretory pathway TraG/TraD family ATPase VirD4
MTTKCTIKHVVNAPINRVAELLRTSLSRSGWRIELINDDLCELTAQLIKSERNAGTMWNYEYHAAASWEQSEGGVTVDLEIREEKNEWTVENCKAFCQDIMQGVVDRAVKLEKLDKTQPKPNRYGSAKWATMEDIKAAGYWGGYDDSRRFIISPGEDQEYVTLTPEDSNKHVLVCGPTGSGKTTAIFIPNLIERVATSAIVTEATAGNEPPDLYSKTAGWRYFQGHQRIYYFNPDDLHSDRINPIDIVKGYADAQALAQLIIENTTSKNNYGDDVWPKSEANLLTILIAHAAALGENLGYIRRILREGPDGLTTLLCNSPVEEVREEYKGFSNTARDGFKYGVIAGLMQRLGLWVNPRICALTEKTDINLETLPEQLFTFYLAVPAQKTHLKPVAALVFNFILEQALQRNFRNPLYLSLDEFTNFGMIPAIAQKLSIIRHKQIAAVLGVQDFIQLQQVYGKDDALLMRSQPGCKVFFRPRTFDVAKGISELGGMTTVVDRKISSSGQITERESGRPLIDPGEVLAMDDKSMIVFTPATDPIKLPRFTWRDHVDATSIQALPKLEIEVDERLVKECAEAKKPQTWEAAGEEKRRREAGEPAPAKGEPKQDRAPSKQKKKREKGESEPPAAPPKPKEPELDQEAEEPLRRYGQEAPD